MIKKALALFVPLVVWAAVLPSDPPARVARPKRR